MLTKRIFFQSFTNINFKEINVSGFISQKNRLTMLLLTNMDGSEKYCFAIGRSKQPRCCRNKSFPIPYNANLKAWMTNQIWHSIIADFNQKMQNQKRNVALLIDNAPCHKLKENATFKNVEIFFLPTHTTSLIQPLDAGIIRSFKACYRQQIIKRQLAAIEMDISLETFVHSITIFKALSWIKNAWSQVSATTIQNCFRKCGFVNELIECNIHVEDIEYFIGNHMSQNDFLNFTDIDKNELCYGILEDHEILTEICSNTNEEDNFEEENADETTDRVISKKEALISLDVLRTFMEQSNIKLTSINLVEDEILKMTVSKYKQLKISNFFKI